MRRDAFYDAGCPVVVIRSLVDPQYEDEICVVKPIVQTELLAAIEMAVSEQKISVSHSPSCADPDVHLRILVADDSPVNQQVAVGLLEHYGHDVQLANNGLEAVKAMIADAFDVVLMDLEMPTMDGWEAVRVIRAHDDERVRNTPIVAMTAHAQIETRQKCAGAGMNGHVAKPIDSRHPAATRSTPFVSAVGTVLPVTA